MTLTFLGTGTSGGVPSLGCSCEVCRSKNPKDKRLRSSVLLESENTRILIDCGPDIRQQLMPLPFTPIDAVLITHIHYDHVAGIDDLRPFSNFGDIQVYTDKATEQGLRRTIPYCFTEKLYPGVPRLNLHVVEPHTPITIGDMQVMPVQVMHGKLPILGFRIGNFAYITDMKVIEEGEVAYLKGIDTLVLNALRWKGRHHSHMLVDEAIEFGRRVGAKTTYFTHMTHELGFHDEADGRLPAGFRFAYDGLRINL